MGKQQDYRLTAAEIVDLAHKATTALDTRRLLRLAEKWLDLADRRERQAAQPQAQIAEHPLVRKTFGGSQPEKEADQPALRRARGR
jgi:hypothetical protein